MVEKCKKVLQNSVIEINNRSNFILLSDSSGRRMFSEPGASNQEESAPKHAMKYFLTQGIKVTLSTDNDGIFVLNTKVPHTQMVLYSLAGTID